MSQTAVIGRAAESFVIDGGRPLYGRIQAAGNKNGALPILAASLLTSEPVVLRNVPRIADVETMLELLNDVGAEADWAGPNEVHVHAADVMKQELDEELCSRMRASFLLAGPLLARLGAVSAPPPGGDVIGRRRLDPHIHAFAELGAHVDIGRRYEIRGRADAGRDGDRQRRLRAARAGPLPLSRFARRADPGHRVERAARRGRAVARGGRMGDRSRPQ